MKYIITCVSVFLLVLSVTVFAQTDELDEITVQDLQSTNQDTSSNFSTVESLTEQQKIKVFSCTNSPVDMQIDISSNSNQFVSGTVMNLTGELKNNSQKTISNGTLYVKVLKKTDEEYDSNLIDHFVVKENVNLAVGESLPVSFEWNVPSTASTGEYHIDTYFYVDNKFDISGVSYSEIFAGGTFDFSVSGEVEGSVMFDKTTVTLDTSIYSFNFSPTIVQDSGDVTISADIVNTTNQDENIKIKWNIYKDDPKNPLNLIRTIDSDATILADSLKNITLNLKEKEFPLYHVVGEISYKDSKSIIEVRYAQNGIDIARIFSTNLLSYPLKRGEENSITSCVYNFSNTPIINNGKILIELKNENGKIIESHLYEGPITTEIMGVKKDFKSSKNLNTFSLHTSVWAGDKLVDTAVVTYDCKVLDPDNCKTNILATILYPLLGFIVILILLVIALKINKSKNAVLSLFAVFLLLSIFSPSELEAKTVTTSVSVPTQYSGGYPSYTFGSITLSAVYTAELRYVSNNALVADGATIEEGTQLKLTVSAARPSYLAQSPKWVSSYGSWVSGAGIASAADACDGSYFETYTNNYSSNAYSQISSSSHTWRIYYNPTANPPTKTITRIGNLNCGSFSSSGVATCTVTGSGPISVTANFSGTYAKFYRSIYNDYTNITNGVDGCTPGTWTFNPNPINLAAKSIAFSFNGTAYVPPNTTPAAPVISGPRTGYPTTNYTFGFRGTDPDTGDTIRYGIDWDNDNTVDEWTPATGYVASGTLKNGIKSWATTGTKTFKARTQDRAGLNSAWTTYSITLSIPPTNGSCGTTNNSCIAGTLVNVTDSADNYLWNCNGANGGTNDPCSLPIPPPIINGLCGASNNICTTGTLFDIADTSTDYLWRCRGENGGLPDNCTAPIVISGPFSVSCAAPSILPGAQATFTATPVNNIGAVSYQWKEEDGSTITGATNSTFDRTYNSIGSYMLRINATSTGSGATNFCYVTVGCDGTRTEGQKASACISNSEQVYTCTSSGWTITSQVCTPDPDPAGTFIFAPLVVADASGTCSMYVSARNVSSCRLIKGGVTYNLTPNLNTYLLGTAIDVTNIPVPIGRYSLECTGTGSTPVTRTLGVQSCIVNPNIREN